MKKLFDGADTVGVKSNEGRQCAGKGVLVKFNGALGAGVLVINAGVVMLNKDCFHDLKPVGFIVAIYYFGLAD